MDTKKEMFFSNYINLLKKNNCLIFMFFTSGLELARGFIMSTGIAWGVKWITEGCIQQDFNTLIRGILLFTIAIVQSILVVYLNQWLLRRKIIAMQSAFRRQIIKSSMYMPIEKRKDKDELLFIFNNNIGNVIGLYNTLISFIGAFGKIVGGYISGFLMSWHLLLIIIAFGFIKILINKRALSRLTEFIEKIQKASIKVFSFLTQTIEGIHFFRISSNIEKVEQKYIEHQENYKKLLIDKEKIIIKKDTINSIVEIFSFLFILIIGAALTYSQVIYVSVFVAYISMYDLYTNPYNFINNFIQAYKNNKLGIERVMEVMDVEINDNQEKRQMNKNEKFTLKVDSLTFEYEEDKPIFKDLSFTCQSGEVTYIVGESGSGKTTLFNVLTGLYTPKSGEIKLGMNGDAKPLSPMDLTYITQTPFLFNGTIAENITLADENDIDSTSLAQATKKAGIDDFVDGLPNQYQYEIKDKGSNFSGGQKSRLALSRSFYNSAPVILFDEIYASVDNVAIESIEKSIKELCKQNACVLFITHRTEWLPSDAKIIYFDQLKFR